MVKASIIYLVSSLCGKAVPFLLLPVLTAYLTPAEFGLVAIVQLGIQFSQALGGLCLNVNVPRKFFSQKREESAVLIFNLYVILWFSCFVIFGLFSMLSVLYEEPFGIPRRWLLVMPILAFMGMSNLINLTLIRTREKPVVFLGFEVGQAVLNLLLSVYFVVFLTMSWEGRVVAVAVAMFVFGILAVISLAKQGYFEVSISYSSIKDVLAVSLPLIPHAIAGVVISVSDRFFIEKMVGLSEVGIYSVGYYFGMVVMLFSDAFVKAWSPWFFKIMSFDAGGSRGRVVKYTYLYAVLLLLGALVYSVIAVWILPFVVSEEYYSASTYIPWICLGYVFFGIYQILFPYLVYCKKTQFVAVATVSAACVNLIGNYYFIGKYGAIGAAYSTVISFALSALIVGWYSTHLVKMPWTLSGKG